MRAAEWTRRGMLGALGAGALSFAALYRPRRDPRERGRIVLDYWEKWTGHEARAMERVVERYNASQSRVFVRFLSTSAIEQKTLVAIAGGSPPDVVGLWDDRLPAFMSARAIVPVSELDSACGAGAARAIENLSGEEGPRPVPERYEPGVWRLINHNGVPGGLPNTCSSLALYFNRAACRDAGLSEVRPARTIDELEEASARLTTRGASGALERAGFVHIEPGWWPWIWGMFFGGRVCDGDRAVIDSPENLAAFAWIRRTAETYGPEALRRFQSGLGGYSSVRQPLLSGQVAMSLHGPFVANVFREFGPGFEDGAAPFPVARGMEDDDNPVTMLECDVLCVPRGCRHPQEAYEFILFTQTRWAAEELSRAHAKPLALTGGSESFFERHPNRHVRLHQRLLSSRRAFSKPRTRAWSAIEGEFNVRFGGLWRLEETPESFAAKMQVRVQAHLDDAARREARRGKA